MHVGDEQKFPKTSVCTILVDLVYLESAKIYTGSKIVRGLKMLRTTGLDCREILEISQQSEASQTERFRTKNALNVWSTVSAMKQVKSKNRNQIAYETLDNSLWLRLLQLTYWV